MSRTSYRPLGPHTAFFHYARSFYATDCGNYYLMWIFCKRRKCKRTWLYENFEGDFQSFPRKPDVEIAGTVYVCRTEKGLKAL